MLVFLRFHICNRFHSWKPDVLYRVVKMEMNSFYTWKWAHFSFCLVFIDGTWLNVVRNATDTEDFFVAMVTVSASHFSDSSALYWKRWLLSRRFIFNAAPPFASLQLCLGSSGCGLHCGPSPTLAVVWAHHPFLLMPRLGTFFCLFAFLSSSLSYNIFTP